MRLNSILKIDFLRNLLFNVIAASILMPKPVRARIYKWGGMDLKTIEISPRAFMGGSNIKIGKDTYINYNCFFDNLAKITIGNNCIIAMEVTFLTSTHKIKNNRGQVEIGDSNGLEIVVKDHCWIGAGSTILPGVTIGENCVIAAGAVVTKDCTSNSLYAGVPAKKVKDLV